MEALNCLAFLFAAGLLALSFISLAVAVALVLRDDWKDF